MEGLRALDGSAISTILVISGHLLRCQVPLRGQRILDVLNDQNTQFLKMLEVGVYRSTSQQCEAQYPDGVIRKSSIQLALLSGTKHEAPEKRQNAFSLKDQYEAFLVMGNFEIRGKMHLQGHPDAISFLTREATNFIPITQATVSYPDSPEAESDKRLVIANTAAIDFLQLSQDEHQADDLLTSIRQLLHDEKGPRESSGDAQRQPTK